MNHNVVAGVHRRETQFCLSIKELIVLDRRSLLRTSGVAAAGALGAAASASTAEASSTPSRGHHPCVPDPTAGVTRTLLQDNPSPAKGWKTVQTLVEIPRRKESGRHSHPGVEVGYIVRGDVSMEFDDGTTLRLRTGDPFFIPSDTIHNARNIGRTTTMMLSTYVVDETKPLVTKYPHC
ncbi:cupin domain-containing protein [Streptomyces sp. ALI-76-A]|uniref:cupin domain-containing protein n=1 Tax=Streptomyces sp. ALI-76-A TaxID=3025736 RepID=UPI00256F5BEC|nr:cupin domain-containing protein [Streptomyces sp. ALI-76-A]MDL5206071.1 cupin domain-containing protein [Streptomyces sp. ALI-76-A]